MNNKTYHNCTSFILLEFKLNSIFYYCIWYLDPNMDETFVSSNDKIKIYYHKNDAIQFLLNHNLKYDTISYDLDSILNYFETIVTTNSCEIIPSMRTDILDFINITTDILHFYHTNIQEKITFQTVYDKLFFGENILNTSSKMYVPLFTKNELKILQEYIVNCIDTIQIYLYPISHKNK